MSSMSADMSFRPEDDGFLEGKMLIAMPSIGDDRFDRTVIYMCVHNPDGAMGIVVNKPADNITFPDLLDRLEIEVPGTRQPNEIACPVLAGGPVEMGRGFVLHTQDYFSDEATLPVDENVGLTASVDILRAMATGCGPSRALLALGFQPRARCLALLAVLAPLLALFRALLAPLAHRAFGGVVAEGAHRVGQRE